MKYAKQLESKKKDLERKLSIVEEQIQENQIECEQHISLIMKATDSFPHYGRQFRCLLCRQYMSVASELSVDARYYLKDVYDERIDSQRDEKFDILQTIALEIANPNMSPEEFVNQFNTIIQDNITKTNLRSTEENIGESNKQLVKKQSNETK